MTTARKLCCCECGARKEPADFYASNQSRCKECVKAQVRANRTERLDYYRAYDRKRYREQEKRKEAARRSANSPAGLASRLASQRRIRTEQPEKYRARNAVSNALRDGKITRPSSCFFCGASDKLQAHHPDYNQPLDVFWLCPSCHGKLHTVNGDFRRTA